MGINETIKTAMREKWEDWTIDGDGLVNSVTKEPSRKMVVEWILEVYRTFWVKL
jgi:hypothetical protein